MTSLPQETRRLQLWPGGRTVEARGEGEAMTIFHGQAIGQAKWSPATPEERLAVEVEELAERLAEKEVLCCDSALVSHLIEDGKRDNGFDWGDVENLYPDPSGWTARACREWLGENGSDHDFPDDSNPWAMEAEDVVKDLKTLGLGIGTGERAGDLAGLLFSSIDIGDWGDVNDWQRAVDDSAPAEVLEWWRITSDLCQHLRDIGQVVLDNDYGYWWGRTCSGQGYIMDGVLQEVAAAIIGKQGP